MQRTQRFALLLVSSILVPLAVQAQSFRTYLASYGNDTNPCTVAQPCRLLPAALNNVTDGGEVWILDSANFNAGTVDIPKSVSILAVPGQVGSIVAVAGSPAITIATAGVKVALRNVAVVNNANNPGTDGIVMTAGSALSLEDSLVANLAGIGLKVIGAIPEVHVKNTTFRNIALNAIWVQDGATLDVTRSQLLNTRGILVYSLYAPNKTTASITDSTIAGGEAIQGRGVRVYAPYTSTTAVATITRTTVSGMLAGVHCDTGNNVNYWGTGVIYLSSSTLTANDNGVYNSSAYGCTVYGLGNNLVAGNTNDGTSNIASVAPH